MRKIGCSQSSTDSNPSHGRRLPEKTQPESQRQKHEREAAIKSDKSVTKENIVTGQKKPQRDGVIARIYLAQKKPCRQGEADHAETEYQLSGNQRRHRAAERNHQHVRRDVRR